MLALKAASITSCLFLLIRKFILRKLINDCLNDLTVLNCSLNYKIKAGQYANRNFEFLNNKKAEGLST